MSWFSLHKILKKLVLQNICKIITNYICKTAKSNLRQGNNYHIIIMWFFCKGETL